MRFRNLDKWDLLMRIWAVLLLITFVIQALEFCVTWHPFHAIMMVFCGLAAMVITAYYDLMYRLKVIYRILKELKEVEDLAN